MAIVVASSNGIVLMSTPFLPSLVCGDMFPYQIGGVNVSAHGYYSFRRLFL